MPSDNAPAIDQPWRPEQVAPSHRDYAAAELHSILREWGFWRTVSIWLPSWMTRPFLRDED